MLAGLSVFSLSHYLSAIITDTTPLVVAKRDIQRGDTLEKSSLLLIQAPRSDAFRHAFTTASELEGMIARTDIAQGQAIYSSALSSTLETGTGLTKLRVKLASVPNDLYPGDKVKLVTSGSCTAQEQPEQELLCTLSEEAQVLSISNDDEDSGLFSTVTGDDQQNASVEFALAPQEALAVISHQQEGPIIAVTAQ